MKMISKEKNEFLIKKKFDQSPSFFTVENWMSRGKQNWILFPRKRSKKENTLFNPQENKPCQNFLVSYQFDLGTSPIQQAPNRSGLKLHLPSIFSTL